MKSTNLDFCCFCAIVFSATARKINTRVLNKLQKILLKIRTPMNIKINMPLGKVRF